MAERLLGKDYIVLKNPGLVYNGATSYNDDFIHIGMSLGGGSLMCADTLKEFFLSNRNIDITCPNCIEKGIGTKDGSS